MDLVLKGRTGHPAFAVLDRYIYAHRGYHDKPAIPENSLPAFQRALERGWGAELDVHLLRDGTLCVFHDSDLSRCTGVNGVIEDLDLEGLKKLRLEGTEEQVPLFDEVLALFEDRTPLIIELKAHGGNHRALTEAVCRRLDSYRGAYCIESFDPRVLMCLKKLRPDVCRGQLSMNFIKDPSGQPRFLRRPLTDLWFNLFTRPDFVAYDIADRSRLALRHCIDALGVREASWTVRDRAAFDTAKKAGCLVIFERFDPEAK